MAFIPRESYDDTLVGCLDVDVSCLVFDFDHINFSSARDKVYSTQEEELYSQNLILQMVIGINEACTINTTI